MTDQMTPAELRAAAENRTVSELGTNNEEKK